MPQSAMQTSTRGVPLAEAASASARHASKLEQPKGSRADTPSQLAPEQEAGVPVQQSAFGDLQRGPKRPVESGFTNTLIAQKGSMSPDRRMNNHGFSDH